MKLPSISTNDIKKSKPFKKIKQITSSNGFISAVVKIIASLIIWSCALIPTWVYFLIRWMAGPEGFWQEAAVLLICMFVIGWLQALLAIAAFMLTIALIMDDSI